jgi:hypothetical protein
VILLASNKQTNDHTMLHQASGHQENDELMLHQASYKLTNRNTTLHQASDKRTNFGMEISSPLQMPILLQAVEKQ